MDGVTLVEGTALANLVAISLSLVLWGFYTCLFMRTMRVLRQKRYGLYSLTTICISLCFIFNFINTVCTMVYAFKGFTEYSEGPDVYFTLLALKAIDTKWIAVFDFTLSAAAISGDTLMLWRLYVVWGRDKRVLVVPVLLTVVSVAGCGVIIYFDVMAGTRLQEPGFAAQIYAVTITVFVTNIATTWYLTSFICYRLWSSERQTRGIDDYEVRTRSGPYGRIIRVLIQSGMLYSLTELFFMLCIATKSDNGISVMADLDTRMIGIVTTLIVLQLNNTEGETTTTIVTIPRAQNMNGHYSVRVTKHTDVKSDERGADDVEMHPVTPDPETVKSHVWA